MSDVPFKFQHLVRRDCPLPPATHVVAYMRDSGGEEQDRSVSQQIEVATEYCEYHHLILDRLYIDEARRSSNTEKREALQEMILDLHGKFKRINDRYKREKAVHEHPYGVVFWKANRLGRDSIEATYIKADFKLRGITVVDLVTSANTGNAAIDGLIEAVQSVQDEQALDEISSNVRRGMTTLVSKRDNDPEFLAHNPGWPSTGAYLGLMPGQLPKGFKSQWIITGTHKRRTGRESGSLRKSQRMIPDPDTWEQCRLAWEMRVDGKTVDAIHEALHLFRNANGYTTFFSNRIYIGELVYGGVTYENFAPAMISKECFDKVQAEIEARRPKQQGEPVAREYEPRVVGSKHLLSGLVYCGAVDGELHPMHIESVPAKDGRRSLYRYVICNVAKDSRRTHCQARRVNLRTLTSAVVDSLMSDVMTLENLRPVAAHYAEQLRTYSRDASTRIAALEIKLAEVRKSLGNIMDAIERMGYASHLQDRYDARRKEEEQLLTEISSFRGLQVTERQIPDITDAALNRWLELTRRQLTGDNVNEAKEAVRLFVESVVVNGQSGTLHYRFPLPDSGKSSSFHSMGASGQPPKTRYSLEFLIPVGKDTATKHAYPDKALLRESILKLGQQGLGVVDISRELNISHSRVSQILNPK